MTADPGAGRRRNRTVAAAALVPSAGIAAGVLFGTQALHPAHSAAAPAVSTGTAPVVRTDLTNTVQVSGSLSYAGSYTVVNEAQGTAYTALPAVGATIRRGHKVYEVDGTPVTLFYGSRPAWRALSEGVAPGPDVAQLDRNLIALGYGAYLTVSDYYTGATAYAVELWQQAAGLPVTGTVPLGQIAFAPGPRRVTSVTAGLGAPPQAGGAVLSATSPDPVVTAQLPVAQEYLVRAGNPVTVTMPDGVTTIPGIVTAVSSVATASGGSAGSGGAAGGGGAPGPAASPPGQQGGGPGGGSGGGQNTVAMTVRFIRPAGAGNLDQAPVTVNIVSARARGVLAVPISALVALAGGGYAVDVVDGGGSLATPRLVPVQTGLFSSTLVQVSGPGITVGSEVEVPSS
ncbi:MAG TPA: peptidoglycan-binding domain-containing protein [Trebonia sp.]